LQTDFTLYNVEYNEVYRFRLQAKNIYGWGVFSDVTVIQATGIPDQMAIPTTANSGANIVITWSPQLSNLAQI
jgi:hypothetical protein